jgi:hypothetical protein
VDAQCLHLKLSHCATQLDDGDQDEFTLWIICVGNNADNTMTRLCNAVISLSFERRVEHTQLLSWIGSEWKWNLIEIMVACLCTYTPNYDVKFEALIEGSRI